MFWTVRGANSIIALRCCHLNGRFEDLLGEPPGGLTSTSMSPTLKTARETAASALAIECRNVRP